MKQSLQLKLGQQLTMTPQLQQAIRLLQLSTLDLQNEIQEALESNPMLEISEDGQDSDIETSNNDTEGTLQERNRDESKNSNDDSERSEASDLQERKERENELDSEWTNDIPSDLPVDTDWDEIYQSSSTSSSSSSSGPSGDDDFDYDSRRSATETLQDHLQWQLNLTPMGDRDRLVAESIIDAVAPNGILQSSVDEIFAGLAEMLDDFEEDEFYAVLHRVQQFDPPGVAAQDLRDCLLIQLNQFSAQTPGIKAAKQIVSEHLVSLGNRDYKLLMRRCKIKESELKVAVDLIQTLNPSPGDLIDSSETEYVVPDVFVVKHNDRWTVQLNPDIAPKIRINTDYAALVKRADSSDDNTFLRDNLQEARWFLKSLQSRNETLLKVATCIVEKQRGFLDYGAEAMKPLVLHDVAEDVGMHESTISRVTTQKFIHTPQGIFELKYFFSSHVSTDTGGECSSTAIRAIIKKLVAAESPRKPLSDSKITTLLADQGIQVARRTIAKYRESLSIPASNERKRLV